MRIPRPPPPAAAFTSSGKPISSGAPVGSTGTPAARAWSEPRSSDATTATVSIPSARHALKMRSAISPLFATSSRCIAGTLISAAMEPVRWGILSTARINSAVIPHLQESPDSEVVAVASRTQARADEYAGEWGIPRAHGSYEALLDDADVEAVYISLPNGPHVEWSVRALEAGKHVLCEKPLARRPADVESAFDAADLAGRLLMEAFMWRHHPQTHRLLELVRGG